MELDNFHSSICSCPSAHDRLSVIEREVTRLTELVAKLTEQASPSAEVSIYRGVITAKIWPWEHNLSSPINYFAPGATEGQAGKAEATTLLALLTRIHTTYEQPAVTEIMSHIRVIVDEVGARNHLEGSSLRAILPVGAHISWPDGEVWVVREEIVEIKQKEQEPCPTKT